MWQTGASDKSFWTSNEKWSTMDGGKIRTVDDVVAVVAAVAVFAVVAVVAAANVAIVAAVDVL